MSWLGAVRDVPVPHACDVRSAHACAAQVPVRYGLVFLLLEIIFVTNFYYRITAEMGPIFLSSCLPLRMAMYVVLALVCLLGNEMYRRYEFVRLTHEGEGGLLGVRGVSKKVAAALGLAGSNDALPAGKRQAQLPAAKAAGKQSSGGAAEVHKAKLA